MLFRQLNRHWNRVSQTSRAWGNQEMDIDTVLVTRSGGLHTLDSFRHCIAHLKINNRWGGTIEKVLCKLSEFDSAALKAIHLVIGWTFTPQTYDYPLQLLMKASTAYPKLLLKVKEITVMPTVAAILDKSFISLLASNCPNLHSLFITSEMSSSLQCFSQTNVSHFGILQNLTLLDLNLSCNGFITDDSLNNLLQSLNRLAELHIRGCVSLTGWKFVNEKASIVHLGLECTKKDSFKVFQLFQTNQTIEHLTLYGDEYDARALQYICKYSPANLRTLTMDSLRVGDGDLDCRYGNGVEIQNRSENGNCMRDTFSQMQYLIQLRFLCVSFASSGVRVHWLFEELFRCKSLKTIIIDEIGQSWWTCKEVDQWEECLRRRKGILLKLR